MKLKKEFIVHNKGEEALLISTGDAAFSGIVQGNKTLGAILELLLEETTKEKVVDAMLARFEADRARIEADVETVVSGLKKIGALDE